MSAPGATVGYRLTLPESWFDLELHPLVREESARRLVRERLIDQPDLSAHRAGITRLFVEQARAAWDAGARYAAGFCLPANGAAITGGLSVSALPVPRYLLGRPLRGG